MHPRDATGFEWDEGNEGELAPHRVTWEEVEQVFWHNSPLFLRNKKGRSADWVMIGKTLAGRLLTVGIQQKQGGDILRAVTGWDASPGERTRYRQNRRR